MHIKLKLRTPRESLCRDNDTREACSAFGPSFRSFVFPLFCYTVVSIIVSFLKVDAQPNHKIELVLCLKHFSLGLMGGCHRCFMGVAHQGRDMMIRWKKIRRNFYCSFPSPAGLILLVP